MQQFAVVAIAPKGTEMVVAVFKTEVEAYSEVDKQVARHDQLWSFVVRSVVNTLEGE